MAAPEGYNALGKIGISYKGDYDSNTTYSDWTRLNITAVHIWLLKMLRTELPGMIR